jgi:hypothetical protein
VTVALTGIALGGSVLYPLTAVASPSHALQPGAGRVTDHSDYLDSDDSDWGDSDWGDSDWGDSDWGDSDWGDSDDGDSDDGYGDSGEWDGATRATGRTARTRPMTSGEQQYRNGCRRGYIAKGCDQFDVPHLLRRGINPYL